MGLNQLCIGPLDHWSIGPLVECQMLKVNKVNLLSERTSGVSAVIFVIIPINISTIIINAMIMINDHPPQ